MNLDDYIEGTFDKMNPANRIDEDLPPLTELEEQQDWNQDLLKENRKLKSDLKNLKELEETLKTFGYLNFEEMRKKNSILNKY